MQIKLKQELFHFVAWRRFPSVDVTSCLFFTLELILQPEHNLILKPSRVSVCSFLLQYTAARLSSRSTRRKKNGSPIKKKKPAPYRCSCSGWTPMKIGYSGGQKLRHYEWRLDGWLVGLYRLVNPNGKIEGLVCSVNQNVFSFFFSACLRSEATDILILKTSVF